MTCDALGRGVMICAPARANFFVMPKVQSLQQASGMHTYLFLVG
jgi:hypothetical protein